MRAPTVKHRCAMCGCYAKRKPQLPLTRRQREVYEWCASYEQQHHIFPTFADIGAQFGWRSPATVHECVTRLVRKGWFVKVGSRLDRRPYATRVVAWGKSRRSAHRHMSRDQIVEHLISVFYDFHADGMDEDTALRQAIEMAIGWNDPPLSAKEVGQLLAPPHAGDA